MTAGHVGDDAAMRAVALAGIRSGKSMRKIAVDLYGADAAAAGWHRRRPDAGEGAAAGASARGPHRAPPALECHDRRRG